MILGEICIILLIFSYLTLCRLCAVRCLIIIGFYVLFYNYSTYFFKYFLYVLLLLGIFVFYFAYSVFLYFSVCMFLSFFVLLHTFTDQSHRVENQLQ